MFTLWARGTGIRRHVEKTTQGPATWKKSCSTNFGSLGVIHHFQSQGALVTKDSSVSQESLSSTGLPQMCPPRLRTQPGMVHRRAEHPPRRTHQDG